jgi:hypothetical protein
VDATAVGVVMGAVPLLLAAAPTVLRLEESDPLAAGGAWLGGAGARGAERTVCEPDAELVGLVGVGRDCLAGLTVLDFSSLSSFAISSFTFMTLS